MPLPRNYGAKMKYNPVDYVIDGYVVFRHKNMEGLRRSPSIDAKELIMDDLNPKGEWDGHLKFKTDAIRIIEFDTDYANSLKLVSMAKKRKNSQKGIYPATEQFHPW